MHIKDTRVLLVSFVLILVVTMIAAVRDKPRDIDEFLMNYIELSEEEIKNINEGRAFAKLLDTGQKPEVVIFGGVYIDAPIEAYLKVYRNVKALEKEKAYSAVGEFSTPPRLTDLDRLKLPREDIDSLEDCKIGDCEIQAVATDIETLQKTVDWKSENRHDQVNALVRKELYEGLLEYQKGGLKALGSYRDKNYELNMYEALQALLHRKELFPVHAPDFYNYLLNYPEVKLDGSEGFFYWEEVNFGLKPTIRVNHVTIYEAEKSPDRHVLIASEQLYSSHYFQVAIEISFCVQAADKPGFHLLTLKGSRQDGLTGFKGSIVRKISTGRARESMENALQFVKARLEGTPLPD